jgi:hypothetical protein
MDLRNNAITASAAILILSIFTALWGSRVNVPNGSNADVQSSRPAKVRKGWETDIE